MNIGGVVIGGGAAGMMAAAAFFAPLISTSPCRRLPPLILYLSKC